MIFKHLHMTFALLSVLLFTLRFIWTLTESAQLSKKWVKVLPHIVDTLLLVFGLAIMMKLALNPLENLWLAEKLIAVVAYIFTGFYMLKLARNRLMQFLGFIGALGWIVLIVRLAITKSPIFF